MHTFTLIFIVCLATSLLLQLWLATRHLKYVKDHSDIVPPAFAEKISLEAHHKAAEYTQVKTRFERIGLFIGTLLLLFWTLGGGLNWLDQFWLSFGYSTIVTGIAFLLSLIVITTLLDIPLSIYSTFYIEQRFGFNRTTSAIFMTDLLKQMALTLIIGTPLIALVLWLMQNAGTYWWFYVWLVWTGFGLLMMWAYPAFIAPLFNKFTPLDEGSLRQRINSLLTRCGFKSNGIFVVDGSRRSGHGNAYFTGLGANKRIVFYDTLINSLNEDEIEAVLAHELGHFKRKHIIKRILLMMTTTLIGLMVLGWLIKQNWFYTGLGVEQPSIHAALALFMMVAPVFTFFIAPVSSYFMRKHEFEADDYAAQQSNAGFLIDALVKMYKENASTLTPDPLYSAFHDSHPPAAIRIAHLNTQGA